MYRLENFCEGPVVDEAGALFISAPPRGYVERRDAAGAFSEWTRAPRANGHKILADGQHLLCNSDHILRLDPEGHHLGRAAGGLARSLDEGPDHEIRWPNDITMDGAGGFYFTESLRHEGAVIHVGGDGEARVFARDIDFANGLVLSPDGGSLFIAESYTNRILVIDVESPGRPSGALRFFADLPTHGRATGQEGASSLPDGLTVDDDGRLWIAHYGMGAVQVLSPTGALEATYDAGMSLVSNLCFAADGLYVTGGDGTPGPGVVTRLEIMRSG
jgi:gluconolactonase